MLLRVHNCISFVVDSVASWRRNEKIKIFVSWTVFGYSSRRFLRLFSVPLWTERIYFHRNWIGSIFAIQYFCNNFSSRHSILRKTLDDRKMLKEFIFTLGRNISDWMTFESDNLNLTQLSSKCRNPGIEENEISAGFYDKKSWNAFRKISKSFSLESDYEPKQNWVACKTNILQKKLSQFEKCSKIVCIFLPHREFKLHLFNFQWWFQRQNQQFNCFSIDTYVDYFKKTFF